VQIEIYENCGRDYGKFCDTVGWEVSKSSSSGHNMHNILFNWMINRLLPKGNLPSHLWVGGTKPWQHLDALSMALFRSQ
ncbi:MAG: hypothetical protein F6K62_20595, partial [Sphaerospermopsis sp. SIO1G2]|nr:hypothetical protein [Sphaerospermopsis sp. SIO1G2]